MKKKKKKTNELVAFLKTFIIAFIVILLVTTPAMAFVGKTLDITPGGEDVLILEEELGMLFDEDSPFFDAFTNAKKVNILLLGVNQGLTDTIMLISLDTKNKYVDLIWIPRDTYYHRPGYNGDAQRKINAAYLKNPVNTAKAVSEILMGMPINYYIIADYDGIANIVDSMGGVPMDIPFNMKYSDPYDKPPLYINIPKGEQVLDGKQSVQFLRYRSGYPEGDIGRIKAQQQFMINAFKQCISFDLPKITRTAYDNITSDISLKTALYLAGKGAGITAGDIKTHMMPGYPEPAAPYYVHPKSKEIAEMITEIYSMEKIEFEEAEEDADI